VLVLPRLDYQVLVLVLQELLLADLLLELNVVLVLGGRDLAGREGLELLLEVEGLLVGELDLLLVRLDLVLEARVLLQTPQQRVLELLDVLVDVDDLLQVVLLQRGGQLPRIKTKKG
jgi:hypothetical protein